MAAPASSTAHGLKSPRTAAITAGSPKIPLPRMLFTVSATKLQRPMARTNFTCEDRAPFFVEITTCVQMCDHFPRCVENLEVNAMDKYSDLAPWILGGISTAAIAVAITVGSNNRSAPKALPAPSPAIAKIVPAASAIPESTAAVGGRAIAAGRAAGERSLRRPGPATIDAAAGDRRTNMGMYDERPEDIFE